MTKEGLAILTRDTIQHFIEANLDRDPAQLALSTKINDFPLHLVSTQIKYLQKAKRKLPAYYTARCIIPPLAYEQSSSTTTAQMKNYQGKRCLDLTCGLGADTTHFARHFEEVIALEPQEGLFHVNQYNFARLGLDNIQLHKQTAESFLATYQGPAFDLIYLDPSRRTEAGKRAFAFEDLSPNLTALLPRLFELGKKILVKTTPLYDVAEAWKKFPKLSKTFLFSVKNECREFLLEWNPLSNEPHKLSPAQVVKLSDHSQTQRFSFRPAEPVRALPPSLPYPRQGFLTEPDVAFYQQRLTLALADQYYAAWEGQWNHPQGYFFSEEKPPADFPGRHFAIQEIWPYKPKHLKKDLKALGISQAHVSRRFFPFTVSHIRKSLNLREGGNSYLMFTQWAEEKIAILARRI